MNLGARLSDAQSHCHALDDAFDQGGAATSDREEAKGETNEQAERAENADPPIDGAAKSRKPKKGMTTNAPTRKGCDPRCASCRHQSMQRAM